MKVFVTGATGVLGRHAVIAMVNAGHDVAGLARCDSKAAQLRELGVTPVTAPLFDVDELAPALEGFDAVCNLVTHIPV
ncbi:MAG: NAD(P)H-binding protein, partial [Nocardioidaceae bacterium]